MERIAILGERRTGIGFEQKVAKETKAWVWTQVTQVTQMQAWSLQALRPNTSIRGRPVEHVRL